MPDSHARRRESLRRTLGPDNVDALLVNAVANVGYLTGFTGDSSVLILTRDKSILVSDGRYTTQLAEECPDVEHRIRPVAQTLMAAVIEAITLLEISRLGFEANALLVADFETLRQTLPSTTFCGTPARVETLRSVKDAGEIASIRLSISSAERAFSMLRAGIRREESEIDSADALEGYLRRCGSTTAAFPPIVAAGPRSALPHARPSPEVRIGDHDFVLVDWGATVDGYRSDLTRVIVTGKVSPKFEEIYRAVLEAQRRAIASIHPGARARDVDAAARSAIGERGFGDYFLHGLGHGFGLDIHELPRLRPESEDTLAVGMVVTVEPGIYLRDWGGIRIEDDILVTPDGCEVLTTVPRDYDAICSAIP